MTESKVFNMDCMDGMKQYPDKYFDLAVVDPPYGIGRNGMNMGNSIFNKDDKAWDNNIPNKVYFIELFRVSKNQIIWGGNYFPLPQSQYFAIWDKGATMYGRDFAECEYAWVSSGGTRIFKTNPNQPDRIHPTQKPVALYDWIYKNYLYCKYCNNEGSYYEDVAGDGGSQLLQSCDCVVGEGRNYRVLDTHLGSGSNRIAADKAGNIDFMGYELDKEYFEAQEKRWKEYKMQLNLF